MDERTFLEDSQSRRCGLAVTRPYYTWYGRANAALRGRMHDVPPPVTWLASAASCAIIVHAANMDVLQKSGPTHHGFRRTESGGSAQIEWYSKSVQLGAPLRLTSTNQPS